MKNVVITGGTSMIGVELIKTCLKEGCHVTVLTRNNSSHVNRLPKSENLQVVFCGLEDLKDFSLCSLEGSDVFYHLAWTDTDEKGRCDTWLQHKNIQYTLEALELANRLGCKKFVGAGSQAEYGIHTDTKTGTDSPINPQTAYGVCKYAAGRLASIQAKQYGIDFFWVRIFSVYGSYDSPRTMISSSVEKLKKGERCSFLPGTHQWDYLHSSDAGRAFYLIGQKSCGNKTYCLGSGQSRELKEYIKELRDIVNPEIELGIGEIPYKDGKGMDMCADISLLCQDTGWEPEVLFKDGISQIMGRDDKSV